MLDELRKTVLNTVKNINKDWSMTSINGRSELEGLIGKLSVTVRDGTNNRRFNLYIELTAKDGVPKRWVVNLNRQDGSTMSHGGDYSGDLRPIHDAIEYLVTDEMTRLGGR